MSEIKAFIFDQDGVIIDTERDGHRVAFNRAFAEFGLNAEWGIEEYHALLQVGGGKERMAHYFRVNGFDTELALEEEQNLIRRLHERKTQIFIELLESGSLPLRPGVRRIMEEAAALGLQLGICTTSNERAAHAIVARMLAGIPLRFVLAGDVVARKKPDPEIYLLALAQTGLRPDECIVFEDSHIGAVAAKAAGMYVVATVNHYTENEDLSMADAIVSCLGDAAGERAAVRAVSAKSIAPDGIVRAADLVNLFARALSK